MSSRRSPRAGVSSANVSTSSPFCANTSSSAPSAPAENGPGGARSFGASRPRTRSDADWPHHSPAESKRHGAASSSALEPGTSRCVLAGAAGMTIICTPSTSPASLGAHSMAEPRTRRCGASRRHSRACSSTGRVVWRSACTRRGFAGAAFRSVRAPPAVAFGGDSRSSAFEAPPAPSAYTASSNASNAARRRSPSAISSSCPKSRGASS